MSLFGSLMGDFEEDPIFGHHMRSMRQMNSMMSTLMPDPFGMWGPFGGGFGPGNGHSALTGAEHHHPHPHHRPPPTSLMPFGFQSMPNINSLLGGGVPNFGENNGASFCSSSFVSMSHGPDGRPQVYQATSSTKAGPGGIRETRKTVQDSRTGVKKMAIGHHIGDRAHIIEREQNAQIGSEEERQDFINLDEDEADDFDKEFTNKARSGPVASIGAAPSGYSRQTSLPAIQAPPSSGNTSSRRTPRNVPKVASRRPLRTPPSSPLVLPSSSRHTTTSPSLKSVRPHPYNTSVARRNHRPKNIPSQTNTNNTAPTDN